MHNVTIFTPSGASVMASVTVNTIPANTILVMIAKHCKEQTQGEKLLYRFALSISGIYIQSESENCAKTNNWETQ